MRVNGLYGHVRRNDLMSLALFGGFILAFELLAAVALFLPLGVFDQAHAPIYDWGGYALRYVPLVAIAGAALFAAQMWWHLNSVRREVGFHYVDNRDEPRLCRIVEPIAIAAGLPPPYVGVIESGALNAFACGIRPAEAAVVVTRGLIDGLDDDELGTVIAHELTHVANRDTVLMAAANTFLRNLTLLQGQNMLRIHDWRQVALMLFVPVFFPLLLVSGFLTQVAFRTGYLSRLLISSAREFIADAEAVRLTHNPAALISALRKVEGRSAVDGAAPELEAMMIDGAAVGSNATHPDIDARIAALARLTGSMAFVATSRRDTRPPELRGFGRKAAALPPAALPAESRPGLSAVLRVNTGNERNLIGLDTRATLLVVGAAALFMLYHYDELDKPDRFAAHFDIRPAQELFRAAVTSPACIVGALSGGMFSPGCLMAAGNPAASLIGVDPAEFKSVTHNLGEADNPLDRNGVPLNSPACAAGVKQVAHGVLECLRPRPRPAPGSDAHPAP